MTKPINENLRSVRIENDNGDLLPLLDHAGDQFSDLIKSVVSTGKAGSLTLKVDVKPSTAGALDQIKDATGFMILQGAPS